MTLPRDDSEKPNVDYTKGMVEFSKNLRRAQGRIYVVLAKYASRSGEYPVSVHETRADARRALRGWSDNGRALAYYRVAVFMEFKDG